MVCERITQTEEKFINDNIKGESNANMTYYNIGRNIRDVIAKNGGTMPEELPTTDRSLKELERNRIDIRRANDSKII